MTDSENKDKNNSTNGADMNADNKTRTRRTGFSAGDLPDHVPEKIGKYIIRRVIASGGMGTVFEALQENPRRPVAVKIIKDAFANESAVKRLEYEAQMLARLRHPGIAQIYEAGSYDDNGSPTPFFAMEYIPNACSITEYAAEKKLSTRERLELFLQVCDAVHHGHQRSIIHRDLKPSNVLVDSSGRVRIIDFGVARATDADMRQAAVLTQVGQIIGSIQYMSPEQFDADPHDIDTRSDVYALGLILYELLSGVFPYSTDSSRIFDFASEVREGRITPLRSRDKSLSGELEAVVHKALQRDRERRYQSAFGLAQDIRRYLAGEAVIAGRHGLSYQFRVFARKNKAVIGFVSGVFVLLLAGIIITTSLLVKVDEERKKAETASQKAAAGQQFLSDVLFSAFPPGFGPKVTIVDLLDRAGLLLTEAFPEEPGIESDLRRSLGLAYMNVGLWDKARSEFITALALRKNSLGDSDDKTLEIRYDLWDLYTILDDESAQLDNARAIVGALTERYGDSDYKVLDSQGYLVSALRDYGALSEASQLSEKTWAGLKDMVGADSSETLYEQIRYAWLSMETGKIDRAEEIARDAMERSQRIYGENSNRTRGARSCLAAVYITQNKIDSARDLYGYRKVPSNFGIERVFQGNLNLSGKPFQLLVFFETWCPYSRLAMISLNRAYRQYEPFGIDVMGFTRVNGGTTEAEVESYISEQDIGFSIFKENGRAWNYFDCGGTPSIRLLHNGYLIWEAYGPTPEGRINSQMLEALVAADSEKGT